MTVSEQAKRHFLQRANEERRNGDKEYAQKLYSLAVEWSIWQADEEGETLA